MTDHAGPRRCECHPGNICIWHQPNEVTQFWNPRSGFGARFFVRPKKIISIKRRGKSMRQKLLEMFQVTVLFHTDEFIFVWSFKNGNGRQTTPRGPKIGYFDGRVPKLSSWVTLAMSGQRGMSYIYVQRIQYVL